MQVSPGLLRLRQHPDAEKVRLDTLALQQRAREQVVTPPQPKRMGRQPRPGNLKIVVLVANPKKGRAKVRFASYASCKSVANHRAAWGKKQSDKDIAWDLRKGFIRLDHS